MEMTGLDVNKEVVIEVACIITDMNFRELETFETIVKQRSTTATDNRMSIFIS